MPGSAMPLSVSTLPFARPWSDSTRPIAATSCHGMWQPWSAASITVAARWYAASATAGMPLAEAVDDHLLGVAMDAAGQAARRGEACRSLDRLSGDPGAVGQRAGAAAAEASEPAVARPAVHAADSTASGSSADAFWARPNLAIDLLPRYVVRLRARVPSAEHRSQTRR